MLDQPQENRKNRGYELAKRKIGYSLMLPRVYREFERICARRGAGGVVLEIGAVPSDSSLLCRKSLINATEKIGINLDGPVEYDVRT